MATKQKSFVSHRERLLSDAGTKRLVRQAMRRRIARERSPAVDVEWHNIARAQQTEHSYGWTPAATQYDIDVISSFQRSEWVIVFATSRLGSYFGRLRRALTWFVFRIAYNNAPSPEETGCVSCKV